MNVAILTRRVWKTPIFIFPIFINTYVSCLKYWVKFTRMEDDRLTKAAYKKLYTSCENGKTNWVTHIKNLLFRNGFGYAYFSQGIGNEKLFTSQFKQTIIHCYKQEWNTLINNSNKLSDYRTYKNTFEFEKYFDVLNIRKYRKSFTKSSLS